MVLKKRTTKNNKRESFISVNVIMPTEEALQVVELVARYSR